MTHRVSFAAPGKPVDFDGARCTPWVQTQVHAAHMHRHLSTLGLCRGKRVLDIACGNGYGAAMLIRNGAASVTAAEIDSEVVARAKDVYAHDGLYFVEADICRPLPFENDSFDVAVCFETIEHIAAQDAFVKELARVLAPNGVLVISTPDKRKSNPDLPNPFHLKELDEPEFLALLNRSFSQAKTYYQGYHFGSVITGTSADEPKYWQRESFLDYEEDGGDKQRHYVIAVATNSKTAELPVGMLHDGAIVSSLNKRIRELEAELEKLRCNNTI